MAQQRTPMALFAAALALLCAAPAHAFDPTATGEPLEAMPAIRSSGGVLDASLTFDAHLYTGPSATMWTRGFSPSIFSPTLRFFPGDTVKVNLRNALAPHGDYSGVVNDFKDPNTTNLHTHGLHVSGVAPADDVMIEVHPGQEFQYTYSIPDEHLPGTHWYHPHHHGSTALQTGCGAAGMLIVEDTPALNLPQAVTEMEEVVMLIQDLDVAACRDVATSMNPDGDLLSGATGTGGILINGQSQPTITMRPGAWYRWRMAYSSIDRIITGTSLDGCEMQLLAKDGVYLPTAPRAISSIVLAPGNRADVAVRCSEAGTFSWMVTGGGAGVVAVAVAVATCCLRRRLSGASSPSASDDLARPASPPQKPFFAVGEPAAGVARGHPPITVGVAYVQPPRTPSPTPGLAAPAKGEAEGPHAPYTRPLYSPETGFVGGLGAQGGSYSPAATPSPPRTPLTGLDRLGAAGGAAPPLFHQLRAVRAGGARAASPAGQGGAGEWVQYPQYPTATPRTQSPGSGRHGF